MTRGIVVYLPRLIFLKNAQTVWEILNVKMKICLFGINKKNLRLLAPVFLYNVVRNVLQFAVFFSLQNLTVYTINQDVELYHLHLQCPCRNFIKNTFFKIFVTILLRYIKNIFRVT